MEKRLPLTRATGVEADPLAGLPKYLKLELTDGEVVLTKEEIQFCDTLREATTDEDADDAANTMIMAVDSATMALVREFLAINAKNPIPMSEVAVPDAESEETAKLAPVVLKVKSFDRTPMDYPGYPSEAVEWISKFDQKTVFDLCAAANVLNCEPLRFISLFFIQALIADLFDNHEAQYDELFPYAHADGSAEDKAAMAKAQKETSWLFLGSTH